MCIVWSQVRIVRGASDGAPVRELLRLELPADHRGRVMTDPAALTDDELAEIVRAIHFSMADPLTDEEPVRVIRANRFYYGASDRRHLIAALRASRAEVAVMTADRDSWKRMYAIAKERADKAEAALKDQTTTTKEKP